MNRILTFLLKHSAILLFVFLEAIALIFYINANSFQKSKFFEVSSAVVASAQHTTNSVFDYFGLKETNDNLSAENAKLKSRLGELEAYIANVMHDSLEYSFVGEKMEYVSASVVSNSVYRFRNHIIIDKGSDSGIEEDMGVICDRGVVGIVESVTERFSIVMPIINVEQRISAKIKANDQLGSLVWDGSNPKFATMEDIPAYMIPNIGDTIVTSGYSAIFPEGIPLGMIYEVRGEESDPFREIQLELTVDFQEIDYVMVTKYKYKKELSELEEQLAVEEQK